MARTRSEAAAICARVGKGQGRASRAGSGGTLCSPARLTRQGPLKDMAESQRNRTARSEGRAGEIAPQRVESVSRTQRTGVYLDQGLEQLVWIARELSVQPRR